MLKTRIALASLLGLVVLEFNITSAVLARSETENINPLEVQDSDPLLPKRSTDRDFSPLEISRLKKAISQLEASAKTASVAGDDDRAFIIWYRVLRLTREIGKIAEIEALGRVGEIAWDRSRKNDVEIISDRLLAIDSEVTLAGEKSGNLLLALGEAYRKIRAIEPTISTYETILNSAREQEDNKTKIETLKILGEQYIAKFDRLKAAIIYEELLSIARQEKNTFKMLNYLTKLSEIYDRTASHQKAIPIKEELEKYYLVGDKLNKLITLKISLGSNYEAIREPEKASLNYKQAFQIAWTSQQLDAASIALEKLGNLYLDYNQPNVAIEIYQQLLIVQQQAANLYSQMNTYDRIGQIYLDGENFLAAINAFKKGLEIASALQHQEKYFLDRIASTQKKIDKSIEKKRR